MMNEEENCAKEFIFTLLLHGCSCRQSLVQDSIFLGKISKVNARDCGLCTEGFKLAIFLKEQL
jgi:hypothetical protein